ncbi:MAG TPA: DUF6504 family protein [Streptosporangiaceae bacterium]|nr:DUF6504 family protein [Streptosporangiaceae bacterium]
MFEQTGGMFRATYNERITEVATGGHGRPTAWTWRGRRYAGGDVVEQWVTSEEWWRDLEALAPGAPASVRHFVLHATSEQGTGRVELARDDATMIWRLIGVLD